jgi:hypothetical protein
MGKQKSQEIFQEDAAMRRRVKWVLLASLVLFVGSVFLYWWQFGSRERFIQVQVMLWHPEAAEVGGKVELKWVKLKPPKVEEWWIKLELTVEELQRRLDAVGAGEEDRDLDVYVLLDLDPLSVFRAKVSRADLNAQGKNPARQVRARIHPIQGDIPEKACIPERLLLAGAEARVRIATQEHGGRFLGW